MTARNRRSGTNNRDFLRTVEELKLKSELPAIIRTALTNVLGETPALVILSYTGDASSGDIDGFLRRLHELLGTSDSAILTNIASLAAKSSVESKRPT